MNRVRYLTFTAAVAFVVSGCTSDPGGGGVNIESESDSSRPTTGTTLATTTTTRVTTTTTTLPRFNVTGRVSDDQGAPVARATVTVGERSTTTGPDGWFALETTEPGTMSIAKPGWSSTELVYDEAVTFYEANITPLTVRGLRVAAEAAGDDARFEQLLQLARDTAVNTFVFDTKQEGGLVLYDSGVEDARRIGAVRSLYDPMERIEQAHAEGLYTITRIVAFDDGYRAAAFEEDRLIGGWLDPGSAGAREYILALAEEACDLGFDEIQFDYIRYPSGATAARTGQLDMPQADRVRVITEFLAEARSVLNPMGCGVSGDVFGIVVSVVDDQGLGQRPEELSAQLDVLSPMIYPSHYSDGWLGFDDPNDHPYDVTADAITDAMPRLADGSQLRPWLQGFWWTNSQIRSSIQAAEDHGVGWILWNVLSNFDAAALPTDAEVGS